MSTVSVLVYSDHRMFCSTLAASLDDGVHEVSAAIERAEDVRPAARRARPDVCALDVRARGRANGELFAAVREECPETRVLVLTTGDEPWLWRAYETGLVDALVSKVHGLETVRTAIDRVALGERFALAPRQVPVAPYVGRVSLTGRERDILRLLSQGATTQEIMSTLAISPNTLRTHIQHVLNKLHAHTRAEAVQAALMAELLVDLDEDVS